MTADGIRTIRADGSELSSQLHANVLYATKSGVPLHLHIIQPKQAEGEERLFPLVVYVQGSAWFKQDIGYEIPQLSRFANKGYVVAVVEYRPSTVAPFPAQIKDTKTAIRFLMKNASTYSIDPEKIVLWGDSSGGHTAAMTGVTLNGPDLSDESPIDEPIRLKAIVDFYGPIDVSKMNLEPSTQDHRNAESPEGMLIGGLNVLENPDKVKPTVPITYLLSFGTPTFAHRLDEGQVHALRSLANKRRAIGAKHNCRFVSRFLDVANRGRRNFSPNLARLLNAVRFANFLIPFVQTRLRQFRKCGN